MIFYFCPYCGGNAKVLYRAEKNGPLMFMCLVCDYTGGVAELTEVTE